MLKEIFSALCSILDCHIFPLANLRVLNKDIGFLRKEADLHTMSLHETFKEDKSYDGYQCLTRQGA